MRCYLAKPVNKHMADIALKYQTGQYGVNQLSKIYKIDKATISRYFKKNNIKINQHAKEAIESLTTGYSSLHKVLENDTISQQNQQSEIDKSMINQQNTHTDIININSNIELANEIIEIVKQKNPQFARGFQTLSALMIKRSSEILQKDEVSSSDIANISRAVSNMNDTLGVFPKAPTIAQQFNIGGKVNDNKQKQPVDLKIEFVDKKG